MRLALFAMLACMLPLEAQTYAGLWLELSHESAPPGGVAQIKLTLTEPRPIIRSRVLMEFDDAIVDEILGLAVLSPNGEAAGTIVRSGNRLRIDLASPTKKLGSIEDLPLFSLSVRLKKDAPAGASAGFRVHPYSSFYEDPDEVYYVDSNKSGSLTVRPTLSVDRLEPAGGFVMKGQTVKVVGRGFDEGTVLELDGERVASVFISETELAFMVEKDGQLDQRALRAARRGDEAQVNYIHLQGVENAPSGFDLLAASVPVLPTRTFAEAQVILEPVEKAEAFPGLALQNPHRHAAEAWVDAFDSEGALLGSVFVKLEPRQRLTRHLEELMPGTRMRGTVRVKVRSESPLQVLGLVGDEARGRVLPVTPFE